MTVTRIAMVGAGAVAQRHVRALEGFADAHVVGVADPLADRAVALAAACGATAYPDAATLIASEHPDAVYVCVPPFAHGEPERAALASGLPLFVEKPLAADLDTAEDLADSIEAAGLVTATGYHWRYLDTLERAQAVLSGAPARLAVGTWLDKVPPPPWWPYRERSGGQVVEQATHLLDVLRLLIGDVSSVTATGARRPPADPQVGDVDEVTAATLRFAGGAIGSLTATSVLTWKHRAAVEVYADGLALALGEDELVVNTGGLPEHFRATVDARTAADRAFLTAVQRGEPGAVRASYAEALGTHRLGCAIARAAREGGEVHVPDPGDDAQRAAARARTSA